MLRKITAFAAVYLCASAPATASPTFILTDIGGVGLGTQARAGFEAAAAMWSSVLSTKVTIRLDVGFKALGSGVLGSTSASRGEVTYAAARNALGAKRTSAADQSAFASLGPALSFLSNEVGNCTTMVDCVLPTASSRTLDADDTYDNNYLLGNTTLLKALGLRTDKGARDASITFSTSLSWDFDRTDGITSTSYDFIGIAAHEIGHALGFTSGVDYVDQYMGAVALDRRAWGNILDLFRYTGTQRDWTVGGTPCTSADGGLSCIGLMSTGRRFGDRQQASHWKDNRGIGILDPTASRGELLSISSADLLGLDIIGWNLNVGALASGSDYVLWKEGFLAPEGQWDEELIFAVPTAPSALALGSGLALLAGLRRRR